MRVTQRAALAVACVLLNGCGSELDLGGQLDAEGGSTSQSTGSRSGQCAYEVTITSVAFYGTGAPGPASVCGGTPPPVDTIMNTPIHQDSATGAVTYGYGTLYPWMTYANASLGQQRPTITFDSKTLAFAISGQVSNPDGAPDTFTLGGLGFAMPQCVDASGFEGIHFDLTGDFGGCQVVLQADSAEDSGMAFPGQCVDSDASDCNTPSFGLTQPGAMDVPFAQFGHGSPQATVDAASIQSIQWKFMAP